MATKATVGTKVAITQVRDDHNQAVGVTVLRVSPCGVVQVKTNENDSYSATQVTYGTVDPSRLTQPEAGHFQRAGPVSGLSAE
ncbi:MAG: hypothetical protein F4Y13_06850 [Acidimicrobiaceae bacterium]|nr:hypothetical protein [Acidimicrobiaceae bacterium]